MFKSEMRLEDVILDLLSDKEWHHAYELADITPRYSSAIERLRSKGYDIVTLSRFDNGFASYKYVGKLSDKENTEREICKLETSIIRMERTIEKHKARLRSLRSTATQLELFDTTKFS